MYTIALKLQLKKWGFAIKPNYNYKITKTLYFCTKTEYYCTKMRPLKLRHILVTEFQLQQLKKPL